MGSQTPGLTVLSNVRHYNYIQQHRTITCRAENEKQSQQAHRHIRQWSSIWNYSNGHKKVVADDERVFLEKFKHAYRAAGNTVEFYYGSFIR
jgi:hypothetical protein